MYPIRWLTASVSMAMVACTGDVAANAPVDPSVLVAQPLLSEQAMDAIAVQQLYPVLDRLFALVQKKGLAAEMQGVPMFPKRNGDKFLPGMMAMGFSYLLLDSSVPESKHKAYLQGYRDMADMTLEAPNETWGMYYYMSALWKLKQAGLLDGPDAAIRAQTLQGLQRKLDWRQFVEASDYSLKHRLPTNYYGVAFSVARLRYLMGWEGPEASEALLQKMIHHYKAFSAQGFSDETDGHGRFDRYSILLIGEIMQRLIETDMQVSAQDEAQLKAWLRKSVDVIKLRMNPAGNGIDYGRSLSAFADTAFAEVLSAAEHMGVLNRDEKKLAYAFATRITAKYVQFWYDAELDSLNIWSKGRRTDAYRDRGRILGENLSLSHQLLYTNQLWKKAGYAQSPPMPTAEFLKALQTLPASTLTKFAGFDGKPDTYDRGLVTYRDGLRVISLPIVNGAANYHRTNPYFAIPYSYNMLSGAAGAQWPQLQPRITVRGADGEEQALIPAAYQQQLQVQTSDGGRTLGVSYRLDGMDRVSGAGSGRQPLKDERFTVATQYSFEPGRITRTETYTPKSALQLAKIELEFASFSEAVHADGSMQFRFGRGDVTGFEIKGLDHCVPADVSQDVNYHTPSGALKTSIRCSTAAKTVDAPFTIQWVLSYQSPGLAGMGPQ
ncbi:hypothetical protein [Comamonas sp. GB3 AK4-5]|uniref:hypothetical protein n=1 Tax=Comamonas sp. GB3 AK4-5 TaxID=3231487 RepID=UPI00351F0DBC